MERLASSSPQIARLLRGGRITGSTDKELGQWAGAIKSRGQIEGVLPLLDGVVVLLEMAGYEVTALALAVTKGRTRQPHANKDAVWIDLPQLVASRGVSATWAAPPADGPHGRVGLWVRPRRGRVPNGGWLDGCAVDLRAHIPAFSELGVGVEFTTEDAGWLTLRIEIADGWVNAVSLACETTCTELAQILGDRVGAAESLLAPGLGLCGVLDPESWLLGAPVWNNVTSLPTDCSARELAEEVLARFRADPTQFLLQDTADPPLTALERIGLLEGDELPSARWAALTDDLGGIEASLADVGELRPSYASVLSWTHMLLWMQELGIIDALDAIAQNQAPLRAPTVAYGGYMLRHGDKDDQRRWGGRVAGPDDRRPAAGELGFVRQLQLDLLDVGIRLKTEDDGEFDLWTERAVREFEIAARYATVARPRQGAAPGETLPQEQLEPVPVLPEDRLTGPICGVLDASVAAALRKWRARGWRHPVVLCALDPEGDPPIINVWLANEMKDKSREVWAWDFSGQFAVTPPRTPPYYVGKFLVAGPANPRPKMLWDEVQVTAERLVGPEVAQVPETERETNATWSTYRVIAAIAKVEIFGRFDALNAWDGAFISVGLYHWTLGVGSSRGEIGALFALLHERDPAAFEAALGRYGVRPERAWNSDGEGLHEGTQYVSHLSLRGTDGQWTPIETRAAKTWFRCWSWFYRMQMACRCVEGLRRVMWDLGRLRIRDVLDRIVVDERPLRDLFTSERTVAMLIRWHVNAPGTLRASRLAAILPEGEPSKWDEQALADGIMRAIESIPVTDKFKQGAKDTLVSSTEKVRDDEDLRTAMGSFSFDESGL